VPVVRPFRALRYDPQHVSSIDAVLSPPYDVVSPERQAALLARDPHNVIRVELPPDEPGDEPDARYRRAARTLAAWRTDGTLCKDGKAAFYVYAESYRVPGETAERTQRGIFARLQLEPLTPGSGVRPHERTLAAPREDRYRLLRATGTNVSPVVGLFDSRSGVVSQFLDAVVATAPDVDATDDDGVRHRLWVAPDGPERPLAPIAVELGAGPITIADGHHRYETALRYRDERRMTHSCAEDPAFDYLLALLLDVRQPLTILPTHRIIRRPSDEERTTLERRLPELFEVDPQPSPAAAAAAFVAGPNRGGEGRFAYLSTDRSALLRARPDAFASGGVSGGQTTGSGGSEAARSLDVALLGTAVARLAGIDPDAVAAGRIDYTHEAEEAVAAVGRGDVAFLLEPTPVRSVMEVAEQGGVMPQKSTYFYPKAVTGLVLNPHEW
jgi:uncharacterized protein (DUF1015 family)